MEPFLTQCQNNTFLRTRKPRTETTFCTQDRLNYWSMYLQINIPQLYAKASQGRSEVLYYVSSNKHPTAKSVPRQIRSTV